MSCDLQRLYGELASRLPRTEDEDEFVFNRSVLAEAADVMTTDRLVLAKGHRCR